MLVYTIACLIIVRFLLEKLPTIIQIIIQLWRRQPEDLRKRYGKWAVVTGASDGIGKAYCAQLAQRNINVVLVGRNPEKLKGVADDLEERFKIETKLLIADFSKGREIYNSIKESLDEIEVGILVNNVGIQYNYPMPFARLPEDEIWDNVNVNLTSATMMTRIVLPRMLEKNQGAIVNISSCAGKQPIPFMNLYAASKAYLTSFSEALREEVSDSAITVQTLTPMYVDSKINHFAKDLRKQNFFIPDTDTYAASAISCLGQVDNTRGYWPHRIQGAAFRIMPEWMQAKFLAYRYKAYSKSYLKKLNKDLLVLS